MNSKVILDVDTGIDDALAIAYAVHSQELDILGITTCFGNISAREAACNSLLILEMLDRPDIPVAVGTENPLFRPMLKQKAEHIHGRDGLGNCIKKEPTTQPVDISAIDLIIEQARKYPNKVTVIALGAMTNLCLALMKAPELAGLLKQVVIMGGAINAPGNATPHAEANIYADPEAAEFLFRSGVPITMVPLDVTMKTLLPKSNLEEWRQSRTEVGQFFADMTEFYINAYQIFNPGILGCALHDPLAVGVVIDPTFVKTKSLHIQVDVEGLYSLGRTIADMRKKPLQVANVIVCTEVEASRFVHHFLNRMSFSKVIQ